MKKKIIIVISILFVIIIAGIFILYIKEQNKIKIVNQLVLEQFAFDENNYKYIKHDDQYYYYEIYTSKGNLREKIKYDYKNNMFEIYYSDESLIDE